MTTLENVSPSQELLQSVERFKTAQTMGRIATDLENQAQELRRSVDAMGLEAIEAPEGHAFNIAVNNHEGVLTIEPFLHRRVDWGDPYKPADTEYEALVSRSRWGDNANINVDMLEHDVSSSSVWGYDAKRRVRVLVDRNVQVHLIEQPTSE